MSQDKDAPAKKENNWTIMIYHSGESSLSEELIWSLKEMIRIGTPEKVEVIALMDSIAPNLYQFAIPADSLHAGITSKATASKPDNALEAGNLFLSPYLEKVVSKKRERGKGAATRADADALDEATASDPDFFADRSDFASSRFLRDFALDTIQNHPAKHYLLILSGHGSGMIGKTLLRDNGADRYMSVPRLTWAMEEVSKGISKLVRKNRPKAEEEKQPEDFRLDILGFDCCGMLTTEVANLLREEVHYLVGSEGIMQRTGWPYHLILEFLKDNSDVEPNLLAAEIVKRCARFYSDFSRVGISIDLSAVELTNDRAQIGQKNQSPWNQLIGSLKGLTLKLLKSAKAVQEKENRDEYQESRKVLHSVIAAHWLAQSYATEEYVDLWDFCDQLSISAPQFSEDCQDIQKALEQIVIANSFSGGEFQHSHGMSLYFPWNANDAELWRYSYRRVFDRYKKRPTKQIVRTPFNAATGWGEFLHEFIYATRRKARPGQGDLIFMPPPGYRDHLADKYATLLDGNPDQFISSPGRTNTQNHKTNAQNHKLEGSAAPFGKMKNPSLVFYERPLDKPEKTTTKNDSDKVPKPSRS
jgi:hypothetical protein